MNRTKTNSLLYRAFSFFMILGLSLAFATTAAAQKKKKQKDEQPPTPPANFLPDEQRIDGLISEMLGAWQIGDIDKLHKAYADDVSVVSGLWGPPVMGWTNYLSSYQTQRARTHQVRMERTNTLVRVAGPSAWACYQWDFAGVVDGQPTTAQGQTTLVLQKRNDEWVIVHNHTSIVPNSQPTSPANNQVQPAPANKP
jgi:uncharacterized protein (TIGR02246 family)